MIYDIIKLPVRKMKGTLSTVVPWFSHDDITWYGKEINLSAIASDLCKYKTVEQVGNNAIERVFYTQEEIDFTKKWWTAQIPVYPIFFKVYSYPFRSFADVYRYLIGTSMALNLCDCSFACHEQTIYQRLFSNLNRQNKNIPIHPKVRQVLPYVVHGDDEKNIEAYQAWTSEFPHQVYPLDKTFLTNMQPPNDPTGGIFLDELSTKNLGIIKSDSFGFSLCKSMIVDAPLLFDIDENVCFSENDDVTNWALHRLMWAIEHSAMTDFDITLKFETQHKVFAKCEFFSKYIGYTQSVLPEHEQMQNAIVEELRKWANLSVRKPLKRVRLTKSWLEEVCIEICTAENKLLRYYFDLAAYSMANLSFVDQFE